MEQARRKLRICLICVVFAAVLAGVAYYYYEEEIPVNQGTLVERGCADLSAGEAA